MSQPNLPFEIEWLNDNERHHAGLLLTGLIKLCKARDHPLTVLSVERIKHIIITDAQASRLEARLAGMLNRPGERIPGAFINAVTNARDRHARAIEAFESAYPALTVPLPEENEGAKTGKTAHRTGHTGENTEASPPNPDSLAPLDRQASVAQWDEFRRLQAEAHAAEAAKANTPPKPQQENTKRAAASDGAVPIPIRQAAQSPQPPGTPSPQQTQIAQDHGESPAPREELAALAC